MKKILVVDDSDFAREANKQIVISIGHQAIEAANGAEALEMIEKEQPDLVLMDLYMPDMDGIETTRRIFDACPTPVVIMTSYETPDLVEQAGKAGVGAYLKKPPTFLSLERAIAISTARFDDIMELRRMNVELQEANRLKSQFLANMSHELRTPLNSIIGFTGIVLQGMSGEISDEQRKQLNMVYDSAKHLLGLINDILDLSKIEAGKIEIIPSLFEVTEIIRMVEQMVLPMIEDKGLSFKVVVSDEVPSAIYHDKNRVKQVLINLISNAAKFTQSGEIRLTVSTDQSTIQFSVADTGIGIKPEHLADAFNEFKQIEGPLKEKPVGTGLGLPISKKIVEMMGGASGPKVSMAKVRVFNLPFQSKRSRR